jgi:hypothetical protein
MATISSERGRRIFRDWGYLVPDDAPDPVAE